MKKLNKFIFGLMSACVMALGACTDDVPSDDLGQSPAVEGEGVYFPKSMKTSYILTNENGEANVASGMFTLPVQRTTSDDAITTELKVEMDNATAEVFTVPTTVQFEAGKNEATINVTYTNAVRGTKYKLKLTCIDGTEYANSTQTIVAEYPLPEIWEKVTDDAVFIDQMFSMFGVSDIVFTEVTVEKLKDKNKYRFQSVYTNDYFGAIGLLTILPEDFEIPYIVLDGETQTKPSGDGKPVAMEESLWFIPRTVLGFKLSSTLDFSYDPAWAVFGSVAYNLASSDGALTEKDYALGTYDNKKEMFDLGVCFHRLSDVGYQIVDGGFQLWLNKSKMEVVYDRDYAPWTLLEEATGTFESGLLKDRFIVELEQGSSAEGEDPIYHFVSLYAEKTNIVFFHNKEKNTVRVPKKQKTGLNSYGNDIYMDAKKASYNEETKVYTFEAEFYLIDEETGKKSATLATTIEKFKVGAVAKIDDYVGNWTVTQSEQNQTGEMVEVKYDLDIAKINDETLAVRGFIGGGYDDAIYLSYIKSNGTLRWESPQAMPDYGPYQVIGMFTSGGYTAPNNVMIGGIDDNGNISFTDDKNNQNPVDDYSFIAMKNGQIAGVLSAVSNFVWLRTEQVPFTAMYRTFLTNLNMKANPVMAGNGFIRNMEIKPNSSISIPLKMVEE